MTTLEKPLSKKALKAIEKEEAIALLRKLIKDDPKPTIYTINRHTSSSGMSRDISLVYIKNNEPYHINYSASLALGDKLVSRNGHDCIRVNGCGMDMGFHLVYNLSSVLFAGQDRAGYVLSHRWL
jgi:hypothetical protein